MATKFPISKISKAFLALVLLVLVLYTTRLVKPQVANSSDNSIITDNSIYNYAASGIHLSAINSFYNSLNTKVSAVEHAQTRAKRIQTLVAYLTGVHSPINTEHYAALIIDLAEANGVDYRIIVSLMGTESGWCKAPIHFNCFGYLNHQVYSSFDDAFNHLIPKISKQYWSRYGWNLVGFIEVYGALDPVSAVRYSRNMMAIANKLYF